jgi:5-methylthioadenosine/S-adenosylhomocysteine deaminase
LADHSKKNANVIVSATWIFTADDQGRLLKDHSVVIQDDIIIDLLPTESVFDFYDSNEVYSLSGHILIPGLINTHTHSAMSLLKGYANDLPLAQWLNDYIWPAEKKYINPRFVKDGSMIAISEMIKAGITTFNDMYFYPDSTAQAATELGIRANIGLIVMDFSTNYANDPQDYLTKGFEFRDQWRDADLITTCIAPHAPYSVSNDAFELIGTYAEQLDLSVHTHLHETEWEVNESVRQYGVSPIQRLDGLGLLGPNLMAAHCVHLNDQDFNLLSQNNVHVIHNPSSNMKLGSGIADLSTMIDHDINICLGSDSSASNNRLDILEEMRLASLLAKGERMDPQFLSSEQVLRMATIHGAKAIGLESKIGSIEKGKKADIVALNLDSIECQPSYDPIATLVYSSSRADVNYVWINGKIKLKENNLVGIDTEKILYLAKSWQTKIQTT